MTGHKGDTTRRAAVGDSTSAPASSKGGIADRVASGVGLLLLLPLCLFYAWNTLQNYSDFWAHAAIGGWIVSHRHPPVHALFLWTWHGPWIAHSWLSEAAIYLLIRHLDDTSAATAGLLGAGFLGFLAFAILWRLFHVSVRTVYPAVALFSLAAAAEAARLLPRPEIASIVLLALLLSLLVARDETAPTPTGKDEQDMAPTQSDAQAVRADVWLGLGLAMMFVAWTNLHGGMLSGLIVLWTAALANLIQDKASRKSVRLALIAALCTLATLINPYGLHYYSIYTAVSTVTFKYIMEWKPMYKPPLMPASTLYSSILLVVAGLFTWMNGWPLSKSGFRPGRWAHLLWLLVFLAMTLQARRNVGFLALVCLAVAAPYFQAWSRTLISREQTQSRRKRPVRSKEAEGIPLPGWLWPGAACVIYVVLLYNSYDSMGPKPAPAVMPTLASGMTAFVTQNGIAGPLFNDYDSSGYLEWRLGAHGPDLYVDGMNAYPDSVFSDYLDILRATPRGIQLLDQQGIVCILGRGHVQGESDVPPIDRYVAASPNWALAYFGHDGPVWIRRVPQYRALWDGVPVWQGDTPRTYVQYLHQDAHDEAE